MSKNIAYVKQLTGGLDLDSPLHEIKEEAYMDANNVTISNFMRRRGDVIPSIGTDLADFSINGGADSVVDDVVKRWNTFVPLVSWTFHYPDMCFFGGTGKVIDKDNKEIKKTILYAVEKEGDFYNVTELYFCNWEDMPIDEKTSITGITGDNRHTVCMSSLTMDLTYLVVNPSKDINIVSVRDRSEDNTKIKIKNIRTLPSSALPGTTIYTARVQTISGNFSYLLKPSPPVYLPYAYPENEFKWRQPSGKDAIKVHPNAVYSYCQIQLSFDMSEFSANTAEWIHVYAVRFRDGTRYEQDAFPVIQKIGILPFKNSSDVRVWDGEDIYPVEGDMRWDAIQNQLSYYNTFRAAALCVKRNILFAGNIIDERERDKTGFDARVFQFNASKKAIAENLGEFTLDKLITMSSEETTTMKFLQTYTACWWGDDMASLNRFADRYKEYTDPYTVLNLDGQHGASGKNIKITFATGTMFNGEIYAQAKCIDDLKNAAEDKMTVMDNGTEVQTFYPMTNPNTRFSVVAIGALAPTHGPQYKESVLKPQWTNDTTEGRLTTLNYVVQAENGKKQSYKIDIPGHTFKNPSFNSVLKCMQHDSVYRLGMSFVYKDGSLSEVMHMGEVRTPSLNNKKYRFCDSAVPMTAVMAGEDNEIEQNNYTLSKTCELVLYPLYMYIEVKNLPENVIGIRVYYGDRAFHKARNVEQTGVVTKTLPPMRLQDLSNDIYKTRNVYCLSPLPFVATQRFFYGGIIDKVHPDDRRQAAFNVPDGRAWTTDHQKEQNIQHDHGSFHYFYARPLQLCDIHRPKPEDIVEDIYLMYAPETDLKTGVQQEVYSPINEEIDIDYTIQTHGFLTSIIPAGANRGFLSAAYHPSNDTFDNFFSMRHFLGGADSESWSVMSYAQMDSKSTYRTIDKDDQFKNGKSKESISIPATIDMLDEWGGGNATWQKPLDPAPACYDTLYMHTNFSPSTVGIAPSFDGADQMYEQRVRHACLMSSLVTREQYKIGPMDNYHVGEGPSMRTLKYFINWDTYERKLDADSTLKQSMRGVRIEPNKIKTAQPAVNTFEEQFAFLWPCSFKNIDNNINTIQPTYIGRWSFVNISPLYTGKIMCDNLKDIVRLFKGSDALQKLYSGEITEKDYKEYDLIYGTFTESARDYSTHWSTLHKVLVTVAIVALVVGLIAITVLTAGAGGAALAAIGIHAGTATVATAATATAAAGTATVLTAAGVASLAAIGVTLTAAGGYFTYEAYNEYTGDAERVEEIDWAAARGWLKSYRMQCISYEGIPWQGQDNSFIFSLHCYSSPRINNHFHFQGGWKENDNCKGERTRVGDLCVNDAGIVPFCEHGQTVDRTFFTKSVTNYHSGTHLKPKYHILWYGASGVNDCSCILNSEESKETHDKFIDVSSDKTPDYTSLVFPDVTWVDRPAAYSEVMGLKKALIFDSKRFLFYKVKEQFYDQSATNSGNDSKGTNIIDYKNVAIDQIDPVRDWAPKTEGIQRTCDFATGLNHHGWGGRGIMFSIEANDTRLPHSWQGDLFQVPYIEKEEGGRNYQLFFQDSLWDGRDYTNPSYVATEKAYSTLADGTHYWQKEEDIEKESSFYKGSMDAAVELDGSTYWFYVPLNLKLYDTEDQCIHREGHFTVLSWYDVTAEEYLQLTTQYKIDHRRQGTFWVSYYDLDKNMDLPRPWYREGDPSVIVAYDEVHLTENHRLMVMDDRQTLPDPVEIAWSWDDNPVPGKAQEYKYRTVDRKIRPEYLKEAFSNGSHVIFSTLRRRNHAPFYDVDARHTKWAIACDIMRDEKDTLNAVEGMVAGFDCYAGVYKRLYMHAFYPDGGRNVSERATSCSSPTVMMFPYEGLINVEIEDPLNPLNAPTANMGFTNQKCFPDGGVYAIKNNDKIVGSIFPYDQENVSWTYTSSMSNYLNFEPGLGAKYYNDEASHHPTRVMYARFNFDTGVFNAFDQLHVLELDPVLGDIHQLCSYKNQILMMQDKAITNTIPDLQMIIQDSGMRNRNITTDNGVQNAGVFLGATEIFTMKGVPLSIYGCSQDGQGWTWTTADTVYWFDSYRESIVGFIEDKAVNMSTALNVSSWSRQVSRKLREKGGRMLLYENRDSTLRVAYQGGSEKGGDKIMPEDFPFRNAAKRQVIEFNPRAKAFTSFIGANYQMMAKLEGDNMFVHNSNGRTWLLKEGIFNAFYMPSAVLEDMFLTAPVTPMPKQLPECTYHSVGIYNTGEFALDSILDITVLSQGYYSGSMLASEAATSDSVTSFGSFLGIGLDKQKNADGQAESFRGRTLIVGQRFNHFSPASRGINWKSQGLGAKYTWNVDRMKSYYIGTFKVGVAYEQTDN